MLADHSFDHMNHNSEDLPRNAYTDVEQDIVSNFSWTEIKGQIISECLFGILIFPKKQLKNLKDFCPRI